MTAAESESEWMTDFSPGPLWARNTRASSFYQKTLRSLGNLAEFCARDRGATNGNARCQSPPLNFERWAFASDFGHRPANVARTFEKKKSCATGR